MYKRLSEREEWVAQQIVDIAVNIHKQLGPGLLESIYAKCFYHELGNRQIIFEKESSVPIIYNDLKIDGGLRLDCLVEGLVIVEFKAQENYHPVWEAQLMSYLKLNKKAIGFLNKFPCASNERWPKKNNNINNLATSCLSAFVVQLAT